jgi:hypothetical protein
LIEIAVAAEMGHLTVIAVAKEMNKEVVVVRVRVRHDGGSTLPSASPYRSVGLASVA